MTTDEIESYFGKIPSKDFSDEAYTFFLHYASIQELESDIVSRNTLRKISESLGIDTTKWGWDFKLYKNVL